MTKVLMTTRAKMSKGKNDKKDQKSANDKRRKG